MTHLPWKLYYNLENRLCVSPQPAWGESRLRLTPPKLQYWMRIQRLQNNWKISSQISVFLTVVSKCLMSSTIMAMPKKSCESYLKDYCPTALTPIILKCFEKLFIYNIGNFSNHWPPPLCILGKKVHRIWHISCPEPWSNTPGKKKKTDWTFTSMFNAILTKQLIGKLKILGF